MNLQLFRCTHCSNSYYGTLGLSGTSVCLTCARDAKVSTQVFDAGVQVLSSTGVKHDNGKLQFRLVDPAFYKDMVAVLTLGAKKYSPGNWVNVSPERYEDALERHWNQWRCGEPSDEESKLSHLVHVAVNAMFLWAHERKNAKKP